MKRKSIKVLTCMFVMAMALLLTACGKEYGSIKEFVDSEEWQTELNNVKKDVEGSGMSIDIKADGNKLIYSYTLTEVVKVDGMEESLKSGLSAQESVFKELAKSLKEEVDVKDPIVVVEYIDANGDTIYSAEFKDD